jgi:hypothetical protein
MARSQINIRIPAEEREAAMTSARTYGLTLTLYLRALIVQDRKQLEHENMLTTMYPQKALKQ